MTTYNVPYMRPALLRPSKYERPCYHCGVVLSADEGEAFLLWDERKERNVWRAAHSEGCLKAILKGEQAPVVPIGSVAAKAVAEQQEMEDHMERIANAPALQVPDAEALAPILVDLFDKAVNNIVQDVASQFTETVPSMVADLLASARPVTITVGTMPAVDINTKHHCLEDVLTMLVAGASPMLVGPAGSGKTTLAKQCAKVLGRPFYMANRVSSEYKLTGFVDANGKTVRTAFREAYEHGGLFLLDEVDASDADAMVAFNAALANDAGEPAEFPDGMVNRHPDFMAIAAGNTFGRGADRTYVGRNQLDAATLDRFQVYEVDYDEQLEFRIAGDAEWTAYVQKVRKAVDAEKVRHVVSPRASIIGAKLLAAGMPRSKVEESCIWKGMDVTNRSRVQARMGGL